MRIFYVRLIFSLLFGERVSSLDSHQPGVHPFDTLEVLDVCASVGTELEVPNANNSITHVGIFGQSNAQPTWRAVSVTSLDIARRTHLLFISIF